MKKLTLVLALCAFIAAPAFADEHEGAAASTEATQTNEVAKAPAKHGKMKMSKMNKKKHKAHAEKAAGAEEGEAAHQ
jgi:hypothetical protein